VVVVFRLRKIELSGVAATTVPALARGEGCLILGREDGISCSDFVPVVGHFQRRWIVVRMKDGGVV
jgi:hypothetical protein